jgi:hypothetical protein
MNVRVAFPVFFRHPEAKALPGDTVLKQGAAGGVRGTATPP